MWTAPLPEYTGSGSYSACDEEGCVRALLAARLLLGPTLPGGGEGVLQAGVSLSAQSSRSEPLAELAPAALSGWPAYSPAALTVPAYSLLGELEFCVALNGLSYR